MTLLYNPPRELLWDIGHRPTSKHWGLNMSLVSDREFIAFIKTELKIYLVMNVTGDTLLLISCQYF